MSRRERAGRKHRPDPGALRSAQPIDFIVGAILDPQKSRKASRRWWSPRRTARNIRHALRETRDEIVIRDVLQNRKSACV
jgi:hypothetical protein